MSMESQYLDEKNGSYGRAEDINWSDEEKKMMYCSHLVRFHLRNRPYFSFEEIIEKALAEGIKADAVIQEIKKQKGKKENKTEEKKPDDVEVVNKAFENEEDAKKAVKETLILPNATKLYRPKVIRKVVKDSENGIFIATLKIFWIRKEV